MARYTVAYLDLVERLEEVDSLRLLANELSASDFQSNAKKVNSLCRGAIVLLSSHLEGYVRYLGETALDSIVTKEVERKRLSSRVFYHISKDILDEIQETRDGDKISLKVFALLERDKGYWSREGSFPMAIAADRFCRGFANPSYDKIRIFLGRFGYDSYNYDMKTRLKADFQAYSNMIDHIVDVRNKVAHGDPGANKTPKEVGKMTKIVKRFCAETDSAFGSWCRKNICSIR